MVVDCVESFVNCVILVLGNEECWWIRVRIFCLFVEWLLSNVGVFCDGRWKVDLVFNVFIIYCFKKLECNNNLVVY